MLLSGALVAYPVNEKHLQSELWQSLLKQPCITDAPVQSIFMK